MKRILVATPAGFRYAEQVSKHADRGPDGVAVDFHLQRVQGSACRADPQQRGYTSPGTYKRLSDP